MKCAAGMGMHVDMTAWVSSSIVSFEPAKFYYVQAHLRLKVKVMHHRSRVTARCMAVCGSIVMRSV